MGRGRRILTGSTLTSVAIRGKRSGNNLARHKCKKNDSPAMRWRTACMWVGRAAGGAAPGCDEHSSVGTASCKARTRAADVFATRHIRSLAAKKRWLHLPDHRCWACEEPHHEPTTATLYSSCDRSLWKVILGSPEDPTQRNSW